MRSHLRRGHFLHSIHFSFTDSEVSYHSRTDRDIFGMTTTALRVEKKELSVMVTEGQKKSDKGSRKKLKGIVTGAIKTK